MKRVTSGFTLIELMITVAIVAILAAIALPSYQSHVTKTRRSDAINALEKAAARQEQFYFQFNQYTDDESQLGGGAGATAIGSVEGFYSVTSVRTDGGQGFTLTAVPAAGGVQVEDTACAGFTLNNLGQRGATNSATALNTDVCWNR